MVDGSLGMVKRALSWRVFRKKGARQWRVEELSKPTAVHGIYTDTRPVFFDSTGRVKLPLSVSHAGSAKKGKAARARRDLTFTMEGKTVYWHRAVAFTHSTGDYEDLGGVKKKFTSTYGPWTWENFAASGLQVDHGPRGPSHVLRAELRICTGPRNRELEKERAAAKEAARAAAVQRRKDSRK